MLIGQENQKSKPNTAELYKLKLEHQKSVTRITQAIANKSHANVTAEDVLTLQQELLNLKHNGHIFRQILKANEELRAKFKKNEKNVLNMTAQMKNSFSGSAGKIFESIFNFK